MTNDFPVARIWQRRGRGSLCTTLLLACVLGGCADESEPVPSADARGNLLVITMDTTRADSVSSFGCPVETTPRLDALAARGVRFTRAYAPMGQTLPTHSTLFTGTNPRVHGSLENHYKLGEQAETLAETLWDEGYETAGFVGALVLDERSGIAQGFTAWGEPTGESSQGELPPERRAAVVVDEALGWADHRSTDQPFFLWTHFFDPHGPYEAPAEFVERIPRAPVMQWLLERAGRSEFGSEPEEQTRARYFVDDWRGYLAEILYTDEQIARMLDGLEQRGMLADTTIVIVGDHGEGLFEHGEKNHGVQLYEEVVHVPLIVVHGDDLAGATIEHAVPLESVHDLMLTLATHGVVDVPAELPDATAPRTASASEIWAATRSGGSVPERPIFLERPHYTPKRLIQRGNGDPTRHPYGEVTALVMGTQKLIEFPDDVVELYDLRADPAEAVNLSDERPQAVARMRQTLARWRRAHEVRAPGTGASVDAERLKTLQALGYAEGDDESSADDPEPDGSGPDAPTDDEEQDDGR